MLEYNKIYSDKRSEVSCTLGISHGQTDTQPPHPPFSDFVVLVDSHGGRGWGWLGLGLGLGFGGVGWGDTCRFKWKMKDIYVSQLVGNGPNNNTKSFFSA